MFFLNGSFSLLLFWNRTNFYCSQIFKSIFSNFRCYRKGRANLVQVYGLVGSDESFPFNFIFIKRISITQFASDETLSAKLALDTAVHSLKF